jgi:hypothetical protein
MIRHQNANAMHVPSQCAYERHSPLDVRRFEYYQGGECLS